MVEVVVESHRTAEVSASFEDWWRIIADVPYSASHFPGVASLTHEEGAYTWVLEPVGPDKVQFQTVYACRYLLDPDARSVRWTALPSVGNARVSGTWRMPQEGRVELVNRLELDLPIPRLMAKVAKPVVTRENQRMVERYFDNVLQTLAGGDGQQWDPARAR